MAKLINVLAEIRKYWWEKSENLINVPGTTISDYRVHTYLYFLTNHGLQIFYHFLAKYPFCATLCVNRSVGPKLVKT